MAKEDLTQPQPEAAPDQAVPVPPAAEGALKRSLGERLKSKKALALITVVVLLLIVGSWLVFFKQSDTKQSDTSKTSTSQQSADINSTDELREAVKEVNSLKTQDEARLKKLDSYTQAQ